jgi:hydrogenase maturation protease
MIALLDAPSAAEPAAGPPPSVTTGRVLVLGIGNVLMGDEGVGVHAVRWLEAQAPVPGVRLLDGGTGGVNLLTEFEGVKAIIMVDATRDGCAAGTVQYHYRRHGGFGRILPELGAHDFGLKDLFAAAALTGNLPEVHLYTVAVETIRPMCTALSPEVVAALPKVVRLARSLAGRLAAA